jgi:hypothetical protein
VRRTLRSKLITENMVTLLWFLGVAAVAYSFHLVIQEWRRKANGKLQGGAFSSKELALVTFCTICAPLVAQALLYYGLIDVSPEKAKTANRLGFYLFVPTIILFYFVGAL